jgi:hypothetical protein
MAVLDTLPGRVEIDGEVADVRTVEAGGRYVLLLPRGQHVVGVEAAPRAVARAGAD